MSKFGSNPFVKLTDLLGEPKPQIAQVTAMNADGTATVTRRGGGKARVRATQTFTAGDQVFLRGDTAVGKAPSLPSSTVSV